MPDIRNERQGIPGPPAPGNLNYPYAKPRGNRVRWATPLATEFPKRCTESARTNALQSAADVVLLQQANVRAAITEIVALGQTIDRMKAALGSPDRVVNLGPKVIYIYKDMKIVFVNGKVSDVE